MIVKFFKYGSGDGESSFNYLLNHRVEEGTSKVLRGSPELTLSIIQSLKTKKKYKSGCLSFFENASDISNEIKEEIMDLFEQTIFPNIEKENRNIVWIEHSDKKNDNSSGRLELNFVIPRVELSTFKAFNPYFHKVDKNRFSAFRDYVNTKFNFTNPLDKDKEQTLKLGDISKYKKNEQIKLLNDYLVNLIEEKKHIKNRDELIKEVKSLGYDITRVGSDYISIKSKNPNSKAIRLRGKYYKEDWENISSEDFSSKNSKEDLNILYSNLEQEIKKASIYIQKNFYNKNSSNSNSFDNNNNKNLLNNSDTKSNEKNKSPRRSI